MVAPGLSLSLYRNTGDMKDEVVVSGVWGKIIKGKGAVIVSGSCLFVINVSVCMPLSEDEGIMKLQSVEAGKKIKEKWLLS